MYDNGKFARYSVECWTKRLLFDWHDNVFEPLDSRFRKEVSYRCSSGSFGIPQWSNLGPRLIFIIDIHVAIKTFEYPLYVDAMKISIWTNSDSLTLQKY